MNKVYSRFLYVVAFVFSAVFCVFAVNNYIQFKEATVSLMESELDYSVSMAIFNTYEAVECLESDSTEDVYAQLLVDDLLHESGMMWMRAYMTESKNEYLMGINEFYGCTNMK